ncbi:mitochondrial carrier domain-containing protein [Trichoderma austrokoningii]
MKEIYLAGAAAAFTVDMLIYPLDTLKTRYQSQDFMPKIVKSPNSKPLALRGLYQGIGSVILATLPAAGVFFATYESAKGIFGRHLPVPEPVVHSCASAVAEMASCLVLTPGEVIKQNAQMICTESTGSSLRRSTSLAAFRRIAARGNMAGGLFSGYTALVARNLPFTALQFPMFEFARGRLWDRRLRLRKDQTKGVLETGLMAGSSAAMAGAVAAFVTTPSDVIKTRIMVKVDKARPHRRGAIAVTEDIWRERGLRGFFRGGAFRCAWTAVGSGLYLGMYDAAKLWLGGEEGV